jgi:hypothetical protein
LGSTKVLLERKCKKEKRQGEIAKKKKEIGKIIENLKVILTNDGGGGVNKFSLWGIIFGPKNRLLLHGNLIFSGESSYCPLSTVPCTTGDEL